MVQEQEETAVVAVWKRIQNVLLMDIHPRPFMIETAATRKYRAKARLSSRGIGTEGASVTSGEQVTPSIKRSGLSTTFAGPLERGRESPFAIAGNDIHVTPDTWVFGNIEIGATATITAQHVDGKFIAKKIVMK